MPSLLSLPLPVKLINSDTYKKTPVSGDSSTACVFFPQMSRSGTHGASTSAALDQPPTFILEYQLSNSHLHLSPPFCYKTPESSPEPWSTADKRQHSYLKNTTCRQVWWSNVRTTSVIKYLIWVWLLFVMIFHYACGFRSFKLYTLSPVSGASSFYTVIEWKVWQRSYY